MFYKQVRQVRVILCRVLDEEVIAYTTGHLGGGIGEGISSRFPCVKLEGMMYRADKIPNKHPYSQFWFYNTTAVVHVGSIK